MVKIALQAGHGGLTSGATGAPGEQELNRRIRTRLSEILISKGFQLFLFDASIPPTQVQDFNLFLALHGDANIYGTGGGFVDYPDPSVDMANAESKRIKECIESLYFKESGIVNHPERSNANTRFYYAWSELTAKTPCVIIEMGVVQDAHDKVILADTERVSKALARGICLAFNVPYEAGSTPPTNPPPQDYKGYLNEIKTICYGKGFVWQKLANIKQVLTKAKI
jgi:N-acetylmuramoyl-L-alanine amidase